MRQRIGIAGGRTLKSGQSSLLLKIKDLQLELEERLSDLVVAGIFVGEHRGEAITSKHQRVGANEHSEMLHTQASAKTH